MTVNRPTIDHVRGAHARIRKYIHQTPVMSSELINRELDASLFFKCENFQKAGAFKFRGASNALLNLSSDELARGVGTHSSGNHAGALAKAAALLNVPAFIVMPDNSRAVKKKAVANYGASITYCEPTLQAREDTMERVQHETGCTFIHPYDRFDIIAGQGTAALELLSEVPDLDIVMAPVGGGGLLSGTAIYTKGFSQSIQVWAGEPTGACDAWESMKTGQLVPSVNPQTMADGLLTSLSDMTFQAISDHVDKILLCDEDNIVKAMQLIWERMKIIIEPSSAVPLGALMQNPAGYKSKKIGIILSGGNVDLAELPFTP
ncbi:MAG: pyridoxal-phosphate dependent enzyme [Bacteroidetes bacterium]|jgi:threonine dehydratase|nr:pyridoxal-phosphate dependent enzyme [Bacteroidota bacterium]MBT4399036.1 pyridoxal-phosphate dependent enzyme [Bacteroidota bacterium]MBT4409271.1 pyridoxal-phosphate dependent enzyme [Bacteroidota bacterium]MBT5427147.1 pyridoxal-phosphate dependent enzyme [Bacteroidota bacterium]MBT7094967.1 pyridoxal-phosphate dependent enzyme [Bacteroidota bacterium]